jgi:hypothetical protein
VQENRLLYESRNSRLLLAANEEYGTHVVKILNQEFPSAQSVKHFVNEFELLKDYDIPGIRKVLGRGKFQNHQAIFLEHIEGVTLRQLFGEEIPLVDKLKVAINLIQVIGNIHDPQHYP